jgi:predicted amidohydrolase
MGTPKRIVGPMQLAASDATLYTAPSYVPNTQVTVIRKIHLYNADTVARNVTIAIGDSATASKRLLDAYPIPPASPYDLWGPFTMAAAETLEGFASAATIVTCTVDAIENEGP